MSGAIGERLAATASRARYGRKEALLVVPLLLWILGVPGLIIILLLLFGVIHL